MPLYVQPLTNISTTKWHCDMQGYNVTAGESPFLCSVNYRFILHTIPLLLQNLPIKCIQSRRLKSLIQNVYDVYFWLQSFRSFPADQKLWKISFMYYYPWTFQTYVFHMSNHFCRMINNSLHCPLLDKDRIRMFISI